MEKTSSNKEAARKSVKNYLLGDVYMYYIYTFESASSKLELSIFEKLEPLSEWIEYVCMIRFSEYNKTPNFYGFYTAAGASFSSRINIVFAE